MEAILSLALIPVAFLLLYIYRKDRIQPEPIKNLVKGVIYGIGSCFIVFAYAEIVGGGDNLNGVEDAFIMAAIPEECAKLIMLWLLVRRMKEFDEPFDGIVYAVCIGMGFAGFENVLYLIDNSDSLLSVGVMRGISAVPGHFCFAVAMGYYYSAVKFGGDRHRTTNKVLTLVAPIFMHGIYDSLLSLPEDIMWIAIIVWIVFCIRMFFMAHKHIKSMRTPPIPQATTDENNNNNLYK